jgi:hypothetical protein
MAEPRGTEFHRKIIPREVLSDGEVKAVAQTDLNELLDVENSGGSQLWSYLRTIRTCCNNPLYFGME